MSTRRATGLRAWVLQRVTAVYLGLLTPVLLWRLVIAPPADHAEWRAWAAQPLVSVALLLFFAALFLHAWVGVRDIVIDYIKPFAPRLAVLTLTGFGLLACGFWVLRILFLAAVRAGA